MGLHLTISGTETLRRKLDPARFRATLTAIIKDVLEPTRVAVAAAAPRRTGKLAANIRLSVRRRGTGIRVSITGDGVGHLVESGHVLVTHGQRRGQVAAHPFARPVVEADLGRITSEIERRLTAAMNDT